MSINDLILAEGDEARALNEKKRSDQKVRFLKKGAKFRGHFVTTNFRAFVQHGDYEKKIQSHACLDPKGKTNCPSCKAGVKRTNKTLVFWYDIDSGEIVVRDVAKTKMATIYAAVDQYGEDLLTDTFEISMGDKGDIAVMYIKPKKGEEFPATPEDVVIDEDLLSYVMGVRTEDEIKALIAGKTGEATSAESDAKIERVDGRTEGPKDANGEEMF